MLLNELSIARSTNKNISTKNRFVQNDIIFNAVAILSTAVNKPKLWQNDKFQFKKLKIISMIFI